MVFKIIVLGLECGFLLVSFADSHLIVDTGEIKLHREILCRSNPNGGSEIPSIYRDQPLAALDPPLGALNPPLSIFSGLSPALILFRAELWIDDPVQSRTVDR